MVACAASAAHAKSEHSGPRVAGGGLAARSEWRSYSGGLAINKANNLTEGVIPARLPSLTIPKPERQLYRKPEGDSEVFDFYLHGRKRARLQESLPCSVYQQRPGRPCGTPFSSAGLAHGIGGASSLPSRYSLLPAPRNNPMLPPTPGTIAEGQCNPLEEPSPLGLTLRKTPSLLDLISFQLQNNASAQADESENSGPGLGKPRIGKCSAPTGSGGQDKLKASNFPASTLKIGTWERTSRYEGDLVAKCYYAKRKLVWEVLDSGLKSKVEIQWSDISAMKATCPDNLPGSLEIEISRPPLFFKETNPQPRKHTLWQATTDFTGGQASICKVHYLQFPEGVLNRHYEKLVQCDPRLKALVEGTLSGSVGHHDASKSGVEAQHEKGRNDMAHVYEGSNEGPQSPLSPYAHMHGRGNCPEVGAAELELDAIRRNDQSSPSSVMELRRCEEGGDSDSGEYYMREELGSYGPYAADSGYSPEMPYELQGMKPAASMYAAAGVAGGSASNRQFLDEIAQLLLGDSSASLSSEQAIRLATQVGSMQAAIGREFQSGVDFQGGLEGLPSVEGNGGYYGTFDGHSGGMEIGQADNNFDTSSRTSRNSTSMLESSLSTVVQGLPRNCSAGDLLMNLPRVASLPQLFESVSQVPLSRYMGIQ